MKPLILALIISLITLIGACAAMIAYSKLPWPLVMALVLMILILVGVVIDAVRQFRQSITGNDHG